MTVSEAVRTVRGARGGAPARTVRGPLRRGLRTPLGRIGLGIVVVLAVVLVASPFLGLPDPAAQNLDAKLAPPSVEHWLGADHLGRDVLARTIEATIRSSLAACLVLVGSLTISILVGVLAATGGRRLDTVLMRIVDVVLAVPGLILALAIVGLLGPGFDHLLIALIVSSWAGNARLARAYALAIVHRPYVQAARLAGVGRWRILLTHIAGGVVPQMLVVATLDLGGVIVRLAGLSFLGLGPMPPAAELGAMLGESRAYLTNAPWLFAVPTIAIVALTLSANLIGEAVSDAARNAGES
ncbi:ABC transporter permease [Propionicicella superfundia]|uniref:ABC transporter permease n=1 Tax=Propionicicella superfundia TaxID=348582 RepID=UPI0003F9E4CA|nr:ABC transporter permease [Propionicicella superfundia]